MKFTRNQFMGGVAATVALGWRGAFAAPARRQRNYDDMTWWDPYVEDITDTDTYLRRKFRQDVTDKTTGVDVEALKKILAEIVASGRASGESWRITKAKLFAVQMEKMSIDVSPLDWFPAIAVWDRNDRPITCMYWVHYGDSMVTRYQELRRGLRARILRNRLGGFRRDYGPHSHH